MGILIIPLSDESKEKTSNLHIFFLHFPYINVSLSFFLLLSFEQPRKTKKLPSDLTFDFLKVVV